MTFRASLIWVVAILLAGFMPAFAADSESQSIYQGKVTKLEGAGGSAMPRLSRPQLNLTQPTSKSPTATSTKLGIQLNGKTDAADSELLKARVLQAAGLSKFNPMAPTAEFNKGKRNPFSLSAKELARLSQYDITVLIDASGSMARTDCEPVDFFSHDQRVSRWEWCRQQTSILAQEVTEAFPSGITLVPFASRAWRYTNVSPSAIGEIFNGAAPGGGTRLDEALDVELSSYFSERAAGKRKKPLLIAVITDGVPNFPQAVVEEVVELSRRVHQGEVRIEFFLIGDAPRGAAFVEYLSNLRFQAGAPYEVVTSHPFSEVSGQGLPRSLAHAIEEAGR